MEAMMIQLKILSRLDVETYISVLKALDPKMLLQMAGAGYSYPINPEQIIDEMLVPTHIHFKYYNEGLEYIVGYCQLKDIDENGKTARMARVMILPEYRGLGYSKAMLEQLLTYSRDVLNLEKVTLRVFDFNLPALKVYTSLGFNQQSVEDIYQKSIKETWTLLTLEKIL